EGARERAGVGEPRGAQVAQRAEAGDDPLRYPVERLLRRILEANALDPRIPPEDVDVLRPPPVRGARGGPGRRAVLEVGRDAEHLARLDVGAEADQELGEPLDVGGAVAHAGGTLPTRESRLCG